MQPRVSIGRWVWRCCEKTLSTTLWAFFICDTDLAVFGVLVREQVGRQRLVHPRRHRLERLPHRRDGGQYLVRHGHLLGGVLGKVTVLGDHAGDRVTLEAGLVDRHGVHLHRLQAVDRRRHAVARGPGGDVLAGHDRHDARHVERRLGIDGHDPGVRVRRAHEASVQGARHGDVVDVAAAPRQQPLVFLARRVGADVAKLIVGHRPAPRACAAPPTGSRRRCSGSRCSGTGCPTGRRGSAPRSARDGP